MDSVPLVAITGNVPVSLLGKDSFQEVDITGVTMPITKHNYIVKDVKDLAGIIREAFKIAISGRPGPVLIDVPKDVQVGLAEYVKGEPVEKAKISDRLSEKSLEEAVELIKKSENPMCYVGGGAIIAGASERVRKFLDLIDAPSCVSLMGCGAVRSDSHRYTGLVGMHGSKVSNISVSNCDLLIVIGARFSDRVVKEASSFARHAKIIQIDVDPAEVDKNIATTVIFCDISVVLDRLCEKLENQLNIKIGWKQ